MPNSKPTFKDHYDNFIGGKFVAPVKGEYVEQISPTYTSTKQFTQKCPVIC
jgi:aldehyde dehydrogenase